MIDVKDVPTLTGATAYGPDGGKIGTVGQVYLDNRTGRPEWVTVHTGLFGSNESFVPLAEAETTGGDLRLAWDKAKVKDAPNVAADHELSESEEDELYRYYGVSTGGTDGLGTTDGIGSGAGIGSGTTSGDVETGTTYTGPGSGTSQTSGTTTSGSEAGVGTGSGIGSGSGSGIGSGIGSGTRSDLDDDADTRAEGYDTSGPTTDDAMTRSEEQVRTRTERVEAGRARLRKYVVTDHQEVTVPVTREEVRVEREPITDANVGAATSGPDLSEEEHEIVLTEDRPVVTTEAVPVERVRLTKDEVTDEETVGVDVREERIETDTDADTPRR